MVKVKTITRTHEEITRKSTLDITKVHRNRDPSLHPFERAREYTKAIVATKLDKMFAKPFIGALDGHTDSVRCMTTIRTKNVPFISGACDGEIKVWDLSRKLCIWSTIGHLGFVNGIAPDEEGNTFYTCGNDRMIKQWKLESSNHEKINAINTYTAPSALTSIDHHWKDKQFASAGDSVYIWDTNRSDPIHTYSWGSDTVLSVKFNPAEACLLASTGTDRSVCLYDLRSSLPMKKFMLAHKSNKIAWNPMEPFNFVLANEDNNLYTYDMRNLQKSLMIHKDHVSAVMDISFSPTGREFVSGSYDRTIRIFKINGPRSRELYHTKRMQKVFCVNFSSDSRFILSGSDDTNIRIWKTEASETLGLDNSRNERKKLYNNTLKKKFAHMPEIKRITRDKNVPKYIKKQNSLRHEQMESERRKEDNRRKHSKPDDDNKKTERKRVTIKEFD